MVHVYSETSSKLVRTKATNVCTMTSWQHTITIMDNIRQITRVLIMMCEIYNGTIPALLILHFSNSNNSLY